MREISTWHSTLVAIQIVVTSRESCHRPMQLLLGRTGAETIANEIGSTTVLSPPFFCFEIAIALLDSLQISVRNTSFPLTVSEFDASLRHKSGRQIGTLAL